MRDITERKEYEYKLMQADRMAAIGFLTAGISHEINNPLTSIAGFSEGLLKRLEKDEFTFDLKMKESFREYLQIIHAEAYRCKEIIQNLKEFSHNSIDDFTIVHIDQIIRDTISLFRQHAKDHNIDIAYTNHFSKEFNTIYGKESQLKHLFLNLFNRALKSMEEGGALTVKTTYRESQIEIFISDTGSASLLNQNCNIFSPLDREKIGDRASGIDLSICYSIVQHHRGDIRFEYTDDGHNIFMLTFPFNL
jgi:signal transduction histidine kinase